MKIPVLTVTLLSACLMAACSPEPDVAPGADMTTPPPAATMPEDTMATDNPMVGGAEMYADRDIIDNASNSSDHTTLVAAVEAAELVETLKGSGPFTVFAPTNAAFDALPDGTVDTLLEPDMQDDLTEVLTYHVVPGMLDVATLSQQIEAGNGSTMLTTVQGGMLTVRATTGGATVTDAQGNVANVTTADVMQSNGVIHVIDTVLMP